MKISALIVYNNDIDILKIQVASRQFDIYEDVYICDGSYKYVVDRPLIPKDIPRLDETEFGKDLLKNKKFKYTYGLWENERVKRIFAYDWVEGDCVVLHDTDEFYQYDLERLQEFLYSMKSVGAFYCQNLFLDGVYFSNKFYSVDDPLKLPHKNFVFKKNEVSAEEHLDYLWLVGVDQNKPDAEKIFKPPVAFGYHLTQMRNDEGQKNKYYFYSSLHNSRSPESDILRSLSNDVECGLISESDALATYLRSIPEFLRVPNIGANYIPRERLKFGSALEGVIEKAVEQQKNTPVTHFVIKSSLPCFLFLRSDELPLDIEFDCLAEFQVEKFDYRFQEVATRGVYDYECVKNISIERSGEDVFGILVKITAKSASKYLKGMLQNGK